PTYRLSVAWQKVAYNQPPHTGFFLGHDMDPAPTPNIDIGDESGEEEIAERDAAKAYVGGEKVTYEGKHYEALGWTKGEISGKCDVWSKDEEQGDDWVKHNIYVSGDQVLYDVSTYEAQWWTQGETPGEADVWVLVE